MAACRSCQARIFWVRMPSGRMNPLDSKPREDGNIKLLPSEEAGARLAVVLTKEELAEPAVGDRFVSHFATCPQGPQHRRPE